VTGAAQLLARVRDRLAAGQLVDEQVPGGRLHIDRPLPFLVVGRCGPDGSDAVAELAETQASFLVTPWAPDATASALVSAVAEELADRFGSFLLLELWTELRTAQGGTLPAVDRPLFRVYEPARDGPDGPSATGQALARAVTHIHAFGHPPEVEVVDAPVPAPLLTGDEVRRVGGLVLGLEIPAAILDPRTGEAYPLLLRELRRDLSRAIQRAAYEFAEVQTSYHVEDVRALGKRAVLESSREVDEQLVAVGSAFEYLLGITPVNTDEAWQAFQAGGYEREPVFHYRHLPFDPDLLKRQLYEIRIEDLEDPTLAGVFRAKRAELDRQITLLEARKSADFVYVSVQLYGGVEPPLLRLAEELLARAQVRGEIGSGPSVHAAAFAERARVEIDHYRAAHPGLTAQVHVRDDVPGVLVAHGNLLVSSGYRLAARRVDALLQHEVGTHVVTWVNGGNQPLRLLQIGLPRYEETQEGLGVFAEYLVGGLTPARLGLLAVRVLAVNAMLRGASFVETFRLVEQTGLFSDEAAFQIVMRVHRSGGLTKDAVYLRGLAALLRHVAQGGSLEPLLLGKLPLDQVPVVEELRWREVLRPPVLRPRWTKHPEAERRLTAARRGLSVLDLVAEEHSAEGQP
jgi:uncharacterized protein (TIGR02421 family)